MNKYSSKFCWKRATEKEVKFHIRLVIDSNCIDTGECILWNGYKDKDGYGRMKYFDRFVHATRCVWFVNSGEFPEQHVICHKCDNPSCVNFDHLFSGTTQENTIDAFTKGRRIGRRGEKSNFCKLNEKEVIDIKKLLKLRVPQSKIGEKYGVSRGAICDIARNRNWKHVKD
jgi:hypothetical protein